MKKLFRRILLIAVAMFPLLPTAAHADPVTATLTFIGSALTLGAATGTAAAIVGAIAVGAAVGLATTLLIKQPSIEGQGSSVAGISANEPFFHIVGRTLTAGVEVNIRTSGSDNKWLFFSRVMNCGPIHQFVEFRISDQTITLASSASPASDGLAVTAPSEYVDAAYVTFNEGNTGEPIDDMLTTWGTPGSDGDHVPFAYANARFNFDDFEGRLEKFTAILDGHLIYDPRDVSHDFDDPTTWDWSDNPALIAAWYVTRPWSFGAQESEVDWDSVTAAANICDELVTTDTAATEKRYRMGARIAEDENRNTVLQEICRSMGGWFVQPKTTGKWFFWAGAYEAPEFAIAEDDIISAEYSARGRELRQRFTLVRGRFQSEAATYQPAPYPQVRSFDALAEEFKGFDDWLTANPSATDAQKAAEAETYGDLERTEDFPYVQSVTQAQRLASIMLQRSRYQKRYTAQLRPVGLVIQPGMVVSITDSKYALNAQVMRVMTTKLEIGPENIAVTVEMEEENSAIYTAPTLQAGEGGATIDLGRPGTVSFAMPDFTDLTNQTVDTLVESGSVTVTGVPGVNYVVAVSGDGNPRLEVNGSGSWMTAATIQNGQTLKLRLTTSPDAATQRVATVTGANVVQDWAVTTAA